MAKDEIIATGRRKNSIAVVKLVKGKGRIFVNGKTAEKMYIRYIKPVLGKECICLPSTSPANAAWSTDKLIGAWGEIKKTKGGK